MLRLGPESRNEKSQVERRASQRRWPRVAASAVAFGLAIVVAAFLILRSSALTAIYVEPVSLPQSLLQEGFTPDGVADELANHLRNVASDSEWGRFNPATVLRPTDLAEVVGIESKHNTRAITRFIRDALGVGRVVRAEIRESTSGLQLVMRITNQAEQEEETESCSLSRAEFRLDLRDCARTAVRVLRPELYLLTLYVQDGAVCSLGEPCAFSKTREFAAELRRSRDPYLAKWAVTIAALILAQDGHQMLAAEELKPILDDGSAFVPARFVSALTKSDDKEAVAILREVVAEAPDLLGAHLELFKRLMPDGGGVAPAIGFLEDNSKLGRELAAIIGHVESMPGETAAYYATRLRAVYDARTGRTSAAMQSLESLIAIRPDDVGAMIDLGDVYWIQSYVETSFPDIAKFRAMAAATYRAATKAAPRYRMAIEKLHFISELFEDVELLKLLAAQKSNVDYSIPLAVAAAKSCDIETFERYSEVLSSIDLPDTSGWEMSDPPRDTPEQSFREKLFRVVKFRSRQDALQWCLHQRGHPETRETFGRRL
jgi:hypothetical protein